MRYINRFILVCLIGCSFNLSAQSDQKKNETLLVQADTLLGREDFAGALSLYSKVVEKSKFQSTDEYRVLYKRAYCYYSLGEYENALADINRYIDKVPDEQAKLMRAYINQELEDYDGQLKDLNEFITSNPGNPEMLRWRASVLMEMERYNDARKDLRLLLQYQESPELKAYLGLSYYYQDDPDSAIVIFDQVIASNPQFTEAYLYASSLSLEQEAYDLALDYADRGLAVDPKNPTLIFYKGIALVEKEKTNEGCKCLTEAFKSGMDDAADYLKNYCYGVE